MDVFIDLVNTLRLPQALGHAAAACYGQLMVARRNRPASHAGGVAAVATAAMHITLRANNAARSIDELAACRGLSQVVLRNAISLAETDLPTPRPPALNPRDMISRVANASAAHLPGEGVDWRRITARARRLVEAADQSGALSGRAPLTAAAAAVLLAAQRELLGPTPGTRAITSAVAMGNGVTTATLRVVTKLLAAHHPDD